MNQRLRSHSLLTLLVAIITVTGAAFGQTAPATSVTGAGLAAFPAGAVLNGLSLASMRFGIGISIAADGSASGDFQSTLLGSQGRTITVQGKATSGSTALAGNPTVSGVCSVDAGDGTAPITGVPFSVAVSTGTDGRRALNVVIGASTLPSAPVSNGSLTVN